MANQTEGFGCRMTMATGNTPATQGQSEYKIESGLGVGIYKIIRYPFKPQRVDLKVIYKMQVSQQLMIPEQVEQRSIIQDTLLL